MRPARSPAVSSAVSFQHCVTPCSVGDSSLQHCVSSVRLRRQGWCHPSDTPAAVFFFGPALMAVPGPAGDLPISAGTLVTTSTRVRDSPRVSAAAHGFKLLPLARLGVHGKDRSAEPTAPTRADRRSRAELIGASLPRFAERLPGVRPALAESVFVGDGPARRSMLEAAGGQSRCTRSGRAPAPPCRPTGAFRVGS